MIDPKKPIEAVHKTDGRVVPMKFVRMDGGVIETDGDVGLCWFRWLSDGTAASPINPWTIRNVAEPEQPFYPDDWAIEEALKPSCGNGLTVAHIRSIPAGYPTILALARMIQRYQPELEPKPPVDPDVAAVREILAAYLSDDKQMHDWLRAGVWDNKRDFLAAVEAFRRVKG